MRDFGEGSKIYPSLSGLSTWRYRALQRGNNQKAKQLDGFPRYTAHWKEKAMMIQKRKDFTGFLEFQQDLESGETCLRAAEECTCLQSGQLEEMLGSNKGK